MTRWPTSPRPAPVMPPADVVAEWIARHHEACRAGDLAAMRQWRTEFVEWCRGLGLDPVEVIGEAARVKLGPDGGA